MPAASSGSRTAALELFSWQMPGQAGQPHCDHTLFVGSVPCYYHNCGPRAASGELSCLCPSDAQLALGQVEDLVLEAVAEIEELRGEKLRSLMLHTACQASFLGIDFKGIETQLAKRGIVCLRQENCRILMGGGPGGAAGSYGSGRSSTGSAYEQLLRQLPDDDPAGEGLAGADSAGAGELGGLLVFSDGLPFSERNELLRLGQGGADGGPAWVACAGDCASYEGLKRMGHARAVLALAPSCERPARAFAQKLGVGYRGLFRSYRLDVVDAAYRSLAEGLGLRCHFAAERAEAEEAVSRALAAWEGRSLAVDLSGFARPWDFAFALLSYGFEVERLVAAPRMPGPPCGGSRPGPDRGAAAQGGPRPQGDRRPAWQAPPDPDLESLLACFPGAQGIIDEPSDPWRRGFGPSDRQGEPLPPRRPGERPRPVMPTRSGNPNFATSGPFMGRMRTRRPAEGVAWGYYGITRCMELLADAAGSDRDAGLGGAR